VGRAFLGPFITLGTDGLGDLELDEFLEDERHGLAQEVGAVTRSDGLE